MRDDHVTVPLFTRETENRKGKDGGIGRGAFAVARTKWSHKQRGDKKVENTSLLGKKGKEY